MSELTILANGRTIRAFRFAPVDPIDDTTPIHLAEIELNEAIANPDSGVREPADRPGRFERGGDRTTTRTGMVHGERHEGEVEEERRQAQATADAITTILSAESPSNWHFGAPANWFSKIVACIPERDMATCNSTSQGDWTGESLLGIEKRLMD